MKESWKKVGKEEEIRKEGWIRWRRTNKEREGLTEGRRKKRRQKTRRLCVWTEWKRKEKQKVGGRRGGELERRKGRVEEESHNGWMYGLQKNSRGREKWVDRKGEEEERRVEWRMSSRKRKRRVLVFLSCRLQCVGNYDDGTLTLTHENDTLRRM